MKDKSSSEIIFQARKGKKLTQKELAQKLHVSDKTISKWERGAGNPDIRIVSQLAETLEIDPNVILSGIASNNEADSGNLKKTRFYICPQCGNMLTSTGSAEIFCCGRKMNVQEIQKADEEHQVLVEDIDGQYYISIPEHPMTKNHYVSFICYLTSDKCNIIKLYPEQDAQVRFPKIGRGILYVFCSKDGLYRKII